MTILSQKADFVNRNFKKDRFAEAKRSDRRQSLLKKLQFVKWHKLVSRFSLDDVGAREIAQGSQARRKSLREFAKREAPLGDFALCGGRGGHCPSTPQAFEKA